MQSTAMGSKAAMDDAGTRGPGLPTLLLSGRLALHLSSLSDLGGETSLDGGDTSSGSAVVACDEVQTVLALAELRVGGLAGFTRHVFDWRAPD